MARLRSTTEALEASLRRLPDYSAVEPSPEPVPEAVPPVPSGALFTLEEEVPSAEWDEPPSEDSPPPDPTWP
jgi:hypothetical protein